ncbi:Oligo-1,6-glucosidase [Klebsiella michiganensis]|uniref:Oligo-1,6-glucosidase n=1 Tax=Klebsiella michiganensis TaxID=1134687 RepID=A0A7H4PLM6_9ENTR|nr:Oligo-1,6-glucosidase [Klebsiella michiganensis]
MYFFMAGTPFIYQGQELGMKNFRRQSIAEFDDISSIDNYHRALAEGFSEQQAFRLYQPALAGQFANALSVVR